MLRKASLNAAKGDMTHVNLIQMEEKKMRDEMVRMGFREEQGASPALLGNGYR
jgi:hypothetical protein